MVGTHTVCLDFVKANQGRTIRDDPLLDEASYGLSAIAALRSRGQLQVNYFGLGFLQDVKSCLEKPEPYARSTFDILIIKFFLNDK